MKIHNRFWKVNVAMLLFVAALPVRAEAPEKRLVDMTGARIEKKIYQSGENVTIATSVENAGRGRAKLEVRLDVFGPGGEVVYTSRDDKSGMMTVEAGTTGNIEFRFPAGNTTGPYTAWLRLRNVHAKEWVRWSEPSVLFRVGSSRAMIVPAILPGDFSRLKLVPGEPIAIPFAVQTSAGEPLSGVRLQARANGPVLLGRDVLTTDRYGAATFTVALDAFATGKGEASLFIEAMDRPEGIEEITPLTVPLPFSVDTGAGPGAVIRTFVVSNGKASRMWIRGKEVTLEPLKVTGGENIKILVVSEPEVPVEISLDSGKTWKEATLSEEGFSHSFTAQSGNRYGIRVRVK